MKFIGNIVSYFVPVIICFLCAGIRRCASEKRNIFRSACRRDALFKATDKDMILSGDAGFAASHQTTTAHCARECIRNYTCVSINYRKTDSVDEKNCQLLSINKTSQGAVLSNATGWNHYEAVEMESPRCRNKPCSIGYRCAESCANPGYECIEEQDTGCAADASGTSGTVTSPNYPLKYQNNHRCTTKITVSSGRRIKLQINSFSTESCCDYLKIWNGTDGSSLLGTLKGSAATTTYVSTGNLMTLYFRTDGSVVSKGFNASWSIV